MYTNNDIDHEERSCVCPYCLGRNTELLDADEGEWECYDCGETYCPTD